MSEIQIALVAIALVAVGGVPADGFLRRIDRASSTAILADDRLGDGAVGAGRADPQPGARRRPCSSASTSTPTRDRLARPALPGGRPHWSQRAATGSTRTSTGCVDWLSSSGRHCVVDRKWLFLGIYGARSCALLVVHVRAAADGLPSDRGPGRGAASSSACPPGATQERTLEVQLAVEHYFVEQSETEEFPDAISPSRAAAAAAARPARIPARASSTSRHWDERHGQGE